MPVDRWSPNVTVAAIIERDGRYLLVEEQTREGLRLNNPAGHLDQGESPLQAVARETLEETARPFTPEALVGVYLARFTRPALDQDVTYLRLAYSGSVGEQLPGRPFDAPVERTLWMTLAELRACPERHRSELVLRCIEDHAAGHRHPMALVHSCESIHAPPAWPHDEAAGQPK